MKLVDIETKITAILWDDEHEEEMEREMTVGEFLDEFTSEGLLEIPLYVMGAPNGRLITADVRPVVRGKWVLWMRIPEDYVCDKCEWHSRIKTNFCPNCGADMREER